MSFMIDKNPNKYGGNQEDYLITSNLIVENLVTRFKKAVDEKGDLTQLFHQILEDLGSKRQELALKHKTDKAELFGTRRGYT